MMLMWDLCTNALDTAKLRGASYGDVRAMHLRQRDLTTKNGQVGTLAQSESVGIGIRVVAHGAWGFASTDRLTRTPRRSEEHTSELQSLTNLVCRLLLEKKKKRASTGSG